MPRDLERKRDGAAHYSRIKQLGYYDIIALVSGFSKMNMHITDSVPETRNWRHDSLTQSTLGKVVYGENVSGKNIAQNSGQVALFR